MCTKTKGEEERENKERGLTWPDEGTNMDAQRVLELEGGRGRRRVGGRDSFDSMEVSIQGKIGAESGRGGSLSRAKMEMLAFLCGSKILTLATVIDASLLV